MERVEWYVDGQQAGTGPSLTTELFTHGTHSVRVKFVVSYETVNKVQTVTVGNGLSHRLKMAKVGLLRWFRNRL